MVDYDVIIGMDFISVSHVRLDCSARAVTFRVPGQESFTMAACRGNTLAEAFLALIESQEGQWAVADMPVVSEF